jgi:cellulose synthase/poly-beta-1,6-N-acetylglucosamine synthase-like glycosyltransferase
VTVILTLVGVVCLLLALHPFVTYPLSLLALRSSRKGVVSNQPADVSRSLSFAICMCAYNEERVIEKKIRNLLALRERNPGLQIFVYVDAGIASDCRRSRVH